ncbi:galactosyltransferase-related protein [Pedobacter borealis]|uniref:galactosyltransferase-related protein n=1 Tax=Pedobacter borealis TaxID=475254 RepID=UPI00049355A0|nr:galactosyltransferase-related protein [Pedobacter borealis]
MILLSAQPAETYFMWQLEIQIENFLSLGFAPEEIHILLAKDPKTGVPSRVKDFISNNHSKASIFTYPDTRIKKNYVSSIRPNIIKQHFKKHPKLRNHNIFYHDSDIVFTDKLPDFKTLCSDDYWYFSDTRSYISSEYLIARGGVIAFEEMCKLMEISPALVKANDTNAGGAQYLLKNVDYEFWDQVEADSEKLYVFLEANKSRYANMYYSNNREETEYIPISSWCADMWAVFWNGLKRTQIKIHSELNFCWPHYDVSYWEKTNIFHNSGVGIENSETLFYKSRYHNQEPYYTYLGNLDKSKCSIKYADLISKFRINKIYNALDTTLIIPIRIDSEDRLRNLETIIKYVNKYFKIKIIVLEADVTRKVPPNILAQNVRYIFIQDSDNLFHRQVYNNYMAKIADTPIIVKYDCDVVLPPTQLYNSIISIRHGKNKISYPYDGRFINIGGAIANFFHSNQDILSFSEYVNISYGSIVPSFGGCCVLDRVTYLQSGMDNKNFNGWGFEDQELCKRFKILGFEISREKGPLYHLDHRRGTHSYFYSTEEMLNSYQEYVKVCNMLPSEIIHYINTW